MANAEIARDEILHTADTGAALQISMARDFNLDVLRGFAILLVVLFHMGVPVFQTGGWIGVDLFFVLSGFLISGLLFREWIATGAIKITRFYIRRGFKIYPGFYAMLLVTVAVNFIRPGIPSFPVTGHAVLAEATFTQNYFQGIWGQTWSLAVEEHFYLLLPLLLCFLIKRNEKNPFRGMPTLFMVIATTELMLRVVTTWHMTSPEFRIRYQFPTHLRLDGLMFGVLLGYYYHFEPAKIAELAKGKTGIAVTTLAVLLAALVAPMNPLMHTFGFTFLLLGFGFLVCKVVDAAPAGWLRIILTPVSKLGYYSYSVYLWHGWACRLLPRHNAEQYVLTFIGAIVPGILMAHAIEIPFLSLRNRLFPTLQRNDRPSSLPATAEAI